MGVYINNQNGFLLFLMAATCVHNGWMRLPASEVSCASGHTGDCPHNARPSQLHLIQIAQLEGHGVHMKDPASVEKKIAAMVAGGRHRLQVVSDFDRTLSRYSHHGKLVSTCHNMLEESHYLPDAYKKESIQVKDTYYPIEIDPQRTREEKVPIMVEWWSKAHALLIRYKLTKQALLQTVHESNIILRDGYEALFRMLHTSQVPLLIFSAGIGDVIEAVLDHKAERHDNMQIVSNYMKFDDHGVLIGFQGDLIHTFNKNTSVIHDSDHFSNTKDRENVILMGDSLGDPHMADGVEGLSNVLKIGFLNNKIDVSLEKYKEVYDIVLVSDETLDVANAIIKAIL